MNMYDELERMHSIIKHQGIEAVNVGDLQTLLRQAQTLSSVVLGHDTLTVRRENGGPWECHILSFIDDDTKKSLFYLLSD
jgi:hypothetical protein